MMPTAKPGDQFCFLYVMTDIKRFDKYLQEGLQVKINKVVLSPRPAQRIKILLGYLERSGWNATPVLVHGTATNLSYGELRTSGGVFQNPDKCLISCRAEQSASA